MKKIITIGILMLVLLTSFVSARIIGVTETEDKIIYRANIFGKYFNLPMYKSVIIKESSIEDYRTSFLTKYDKVTWVDKTTESVVVTPITKPVTTTELKIIYICEGRVDNPTECPFGLAGNNYRCCQLEKDCTKNFKACSGGWELMK